MTVSLRRTAVWASLVTLVAGAFVIVLLNLMLRHAGRADLATDASWENAGYWMAVVAAAAVGSLLALRLPRHPVGWLLLLLGLSIELSGITDDWARYAVLARPGGFGGPVAAVVQSRSFILWFIPLGLVLLLTPDGQVPGPRWRWAVRMVVGGGGLGLALTLLRPGPIEDPNFAHMANPLGLSPAGAGPVRVVAFLALLAMNVFGLLGGVAALLVRFRRARGLQRQQLLWVAFGAGVVAVGVLNQLWISALLRDSPRTEDLLLGANAGLTLAVLPVTTGVAILQYRLYDLGRLVSRSVSYALLTAAVAGAYVVAVVVLGLIVGRDAPLAVAGATLCGASMFGLARRRVQDQVDRRFNRRRWQALRMVADFTRSAAGPGSDRSTIEEVLAAALGDPTLSVAYPLSSGDGWVSTDGTPVAPPQPSPARLVNVAIRRGAVVAAVTCSAGLAGGPGTAAAVTDTAATELDNARLRAEVRLQLVEVRQSRARIVAAGDAERRRIERNLHDGAQQRLVALGLQLRTSHRRVVNGGDVYVAAGALDHAADELARATEELRELANGLHPSIVFEEGLGVALEALADRSPVAVELDAPQLRAAPELESVAYYVACEGLSNAIKHAGASRVEISASVSAGSLVLIVVDDGVGGASVAGGTGLQGLADRVESAGGTLTVVSPVGEGTTLKAELPCGS